LIFSQDIGSLTRFDRCGDFAPAHPAYFIKDENIGA